MKTTFFKLSLSVFFIGIMSANLLFAQKSPKAEASASVGSGKVTINYSQPSVKGREVWGKLVPYDKVWRTGADDATTIEFAKDATVEGKKVAAGKYSLFTIPTKSGEWTIIINKTAKQWGAYDYKEADDVLRVKVQSAKATALTEKMTFTVEASGVVTLLWENLKVSFKVTQ
ncbi:MAG: DUF2911 domain-containing protein [Cytophagales bacterium]|nr:MAG: DUF2911 domain-containing protein [Cytophagales bacterium]